MVTSLYLIPFLTAFIIVLTPKPKWIRWVALCGALATSAVTLYLTYTFFSSPNGIQESGISGLTPLFREERLEWFQNLGISYLVGLDGLSLAMVMLTSLIITTGVLASWEVKERGKEFFAWLFLLAGGVFGVFVSFDLFLFLMFYEIAVLPMYLLIGIWGTGPKEYSAMKLTLMLLAGSALIIVGILALYQGAGGTTFDLTALSRHSYPIEFQRWVYPLLFVGFGVIGALYPLHTWSPDGHASAPTAVSMLHAGVLMKLGGYGILRIAVFLLPEGATYWSSFFMILATISIVYGSLGAIRQRDLKYFTAYSSVSHCGFVLFGICTLNLIGLKGAAFQMVSHGVMTGLFFALIGMVYGRTHTRMIDEMGGLARVIPWLAVAFFIGGLASLGLPGLSGFIAEFHVFLGGFFGKASTTGLPLSRVLTLIATTSVVITAVYVLRGITAVFWGSLKNSHQAHLSPVTFSEKWTTGLLVGALFLMGLWPAPLLRLMEKTLVHLTDRLGGI